MIEDTLDKHMEEKYGATACSECGEVNPDSDTSDTCKDCYGEGTLPDDVYESMRDDGVRP